MNRVKELSEISSQPRYALAYMAAAFLAQTKTDVSLNEPKNCCANVVFVHGMRRLGDKSFAWPDVKEQTGQGAPAPPQVQARGSCHGRSGWCSQTQPCIS
jgi:hypothetical protein